MGWGMLGGKNSRYLCEVCVEEKVREWYCAYYKKLIIFINTILF